MKNSIVYFTKDISSKSVISLYEKLNIKLRGNIAVKLHSGEEGNTNYIGPLFFKDFIDYINGTVVECNTAYDGARNTTDKHLQLLKDHEWSKYFNTVIMDASGDVIWPIEDGVAIKENYVGSKILDFDSMIVLSHFKGHPMGGYGGALKQLSIGVSSSYGKAYIHGVGDARPEARWTSDHDSFLESMSDAAASIVRHFHGNMAFINVMKNLSVDCDCCEVAEDPCMKDIGFLASTDPVAIDQACMDLINAQTDDPGLPHFLERVNSRHGVHTIEAAAKIGVGSREYELIEI